MHYLKLLFALLISALIACKVKQSTHAPKNDGLGLYTGITPCGDCEGIYTVIHLITRDSFWCQIRYLGKPQLAETVYGTYTWNQQTESIRLQCSSNLVPVYFKLTQQGLIQLNTKGEVIEGNLANAYILYKVDEQLCNTKWVLSEYKGHSYVAAPHQEAIYLKFDIQSGLIYGFDGCNHFSAQFILTKSQRLKLDQVQSTLKACEVLDGTDDFMKLISQSDQVMISGTELTLSKAKMAPLVRFTPAVK